MVNRQIWPNDIQPIEDLTFVPVEKSYIKVLIVRIALVYGILMAGVIAVSSLAEWNIGWIVIAIECLLTVGFAVNATLLKKIYAMRGYALRDKDISYRKGLFFTSVTTIPFCKIQQVSMRMNPFSRIFSLCYLDVTNGSQAAMNDITIPGLTREKAAHLKSLLINKADCDNE